MSKGLPLSAVLLLLIAASGCAGSPPHTTAPSTSSTALLPTSAATPATAEPGSAPVSSPLPTPPANAIVISGIEESTSQWNSCSDCAGGLNNTTDFWTAPAQTTPSLDGSSREFQVGGPQWTAALFYHSVQSYSGQYNSATHFLWDFYVYVDDASMQNVWDLEFDLYQAIGGYEYMIGTHCLFRGNQTGDYWYGWDQATNQWIATSAPCSRALFASNQWHHIQWMLERIPNSTSYKYDTLVVDGVPYSINMVQNAAPSSWNDVLGVQWQIDTNSNGGPAHEWIDKVKLTIW